LVQTERVCGGNSDRATRRCLPSFGICNKLSGASQCGIRIKMNSNPVRVGPQTFQRIRRGGGEEEQCVLSLVVCGGNSNCAPRRRLSAWGACNNHRVLRSGYHPRSGASPTWVLEQARPVGLGFAGTDFLRGLPPWSTSVCLNPSFGAGCGR
jgi:hypothetical protein